MSDEQVVIEVTDSGTTQSVIQLLEQLGVAADEAAARVASGAVNQSSSLSTIAASEKIVSAARQAGLEDVSNLRSALDLLTTREQVSAAAAESLTNFVAQLAEASRAEASAAGQEAEVQAGLANAYKGRAEAAETALSAASALTRVGTSGTSAALAYRDALNGGTGSVVSFGDNAKTSATKVLTLEEAATRVKSSISGLAFSFGAFITAQAAFKASDEITNLSNQLETATGKGAGFSAELGKLVTVANDSQSSLDGVVNVFVRFKAAIGDAGVSNEHLNDAVQGLVGTLKITGSTTQETNRVLKDLSEALGTGSIGGRQLNSILQQAPAFAKAFGDALGTNLFALKEHTSKVDELQTKLEGLNNKNEEAGGSVSGLASKLESEQSKLANLNAEYTRGTLSVDKLVGSVNKHTSASEKAALVSATYSEKSAQLNAAINTTAARLNTARDAQDQKTQAEIKATRSALDLARAEESITDTKIVDTLAQLKDTYGKLSASQTTFAGTFEVLRNNFELLFIQGTKTSVAMNALKSVILLIANNLDKVIPALAGVSVAFAALKISSIIKNFSEFVTVLNLTSRAQAALNLVINANPYVLIATAIIGIIAYFTDWSKIIAVVTPYIQALGDTIQDVFKKAQPLLDQANAFWDKYGDTITRVVTTVVGTSIVLLIKSFNNIIDVAIKIGETIGDMAANIIINLGKIEKDADGFVSVVVNAFNTVISAIKTLISWYNALAQAVAGASAGGAVTTPVASAGGTGHARDGATLMVPGGTGVDSVTAVMKVSPGERITIETPAQHYGNFRDGGQVVQGVIPTTSTTQSVAGYTPTAFTAPQVTTATNSSAANDNASSVVQAAQTINAVSKFVGGSNSVVDTTVSEAAKTRQTDQNKAYVATEKQAILDNATALNNRLQVTINGTVFDSLNGTVEITPGYTGGGTPQEALTAAKSFISKRAQSSADMLHARDGMDYFVPGGGGVDSQKMNLAVSPGERVQVHTRQQQDEQKASPAGRGVVNFHTNIYAQDVRGAGQSADQIAASQQRQQRRLARR